MFLSKNFLKINLNFRKVKTSFSRENICTFPSYEKLSQHWRSNIVVEAHPVYEGDTDIINSMFFDPAEFLPRHMARWLEKRDLEGSPLPPGCYRVKFKVYHLHTWTENQCGQGGLYHGAQFLIFPGEENFVLSSLREEKQNLS